MGQGPQYKWRSVVITGASSGLGRALAMELAAPGRHLAITGRNDARLGAVRADLEQRGAEVSAAVLDARDRAAMATWLTRQDAATPVDLVIANAGVSSATLSADDQPANDLQALSHIFDINVTGVLNTIQPLIAPMQARGTGQIVLMGSLAGFRGMPYAPGYSAGKVAVHALAEALRGRLAPDGVGVSLIAPGFIRSRITDANDFWMPLYMEAAPAARIMLQGAARNARLISFPWPMSLASRLMPLLPGGLYQALMRLNPAEK